LTSQLAFARPSIGEEEISAVVEVMRSGWLTTGKRVKEFEEEFARSVSARHAVAVCSATAGLHLALEAVGVGDGDRVVTTPYTFTATAEVIRYLGADPVFVDIDPKTHNIDVEQVASLLAKDPAKIKAVIPVHFGGQACEMGELLAIGDEYGLRIVEDAAHAFPASFQGRCVGAVGDVTVFSFYATKTITTGEGGMITTQDPVLARRMETMRLHGIDRDVFNRYAATRPSWYYEVVAPGFKYNMTDIAAAIGIHQLAKAEDFRRRREEIARQYDEAFSDLPLRLPWVAHPEDTHAWHLYVIQLELEKLRIDRDRFIELMSDEGIGTSVHFIPLHLQPYWSNRYKLGTGAFPIAEDVYRRAVSLPIYPAMTDEDVQRVIAAVRRILDRFRN
jgi:UDP-4-amino-4,6-dideoxy-N-acetyl-beta-L-altrosamine transaminase